MVTKFKNSSQNTQPRRPRKSGQRGSAMFEYAIVVLISLMLLFGLVDFGRALYAYHFISNAAREGTRYASVRGRLCNGTFPTACPASSADIQNFVQNVPVGIDPAAVTVNSNFRNPNNLPVCNTTNDYPGCAIHVRVGYNFKFTFPLLPITIPMSSTSEMIISR
jgi:Flp pilus assembly protein TadG